MMAKDHGAAAFFAGDAIEVPTTQARAQRAERAPLGHLVHHDGIGVLVFYAVGDLHFLKELGQNCRRKPRLPLIKVTGQ